jgi:hypothetical protein
MTALTLRIAAPMQLPGNGSLQVQQIQQAQLKTRRVFVI